jgi:hypothetical protein
MTAVNQEAEGVELWMLVYWFGCASPRQWPISCITAVLKTFPATAAVVQPLLRIHTVPLSIAENLESPLKLSIGESARLGALTPRAPPSHGMKQHAHEFAAARFEVAEVVGVVDEPHLVGVAVQYA